jgi:hypothetical protein
MRNITLDDGGKKPALAKGFTKIGGAGPAAVGRFKKVGVVVSGSGTGCEVKGLGGAMKDMAEEEVKNADVQKVETVPSKTTAEIPAADTVAENQDDIKDVEDIAMGESEDAEDITWEEYDFTKPTDCDHANCPGCKAVAKYDEDGWVIFEASEKNAMSVMV